MEKIKLNKEQEKRFMTQWLSGDIFGIEEIEKILKEEIKLIDNMESYSIFDTIAYCKSLNSMKVATEMWSDLEDMESEIENLYDKIKNKLFDSFENDFNEYWG